MKICKKIFLSLMCLSSLIIASCTTRTISGVDNSNSQEQHQSTSSLVSSSSSSDESSYNSSSNSVSSSLVHVHDWGTPIYTWSDDCSTCTAEIVCQIDSTHKITETVETIPTILPTSGVFESEITTYEYIANFEYSGFESQKKEKQAPYLGEYLTFKNDETQLKYGLYPQTNVNDSTLVSSLDALTTPESNGWYLYNNEYYAKVSATPDQSDYQFDNGTTIVRRTTYWFKCEPIVWNILSNNSGEYYVLSSVLLDAHRYNNCYTSSYKDEDGHYWNNYEYSEIRSWLNNDFYNSAFALGNSHIQTTTVDNSAATTNSSSNSFACNNTEDKVFLPSYQDYINSSYGFSTSRYDIVTRCCKTTDWARAKGASYERQYESYKYNGTYWTRSPGDFHDRAYYVDTVGVLGEWEVRDTYRSVRPCLSIRIA